VAGGREGLAEALLDLQELAERLRRDCPWDRAQTAGTIVPHTVEESYEVADAAKTGDDEKLLDELGDLLFQVVFLSLLLEESNKGSLEQVIRGIHAKLVRRHPHVFVAPGELRTAGAVKERWETLKAAQERREGIFHDIPRSLPALLLAKKVQRRAASVGFDYRGLPQALADLRDELGELDEELARSGSALEAEADAGLEAELGDVLFACVNVARLASVDPELALRGAAARFVARVERAEELAEASNRSFVALDLDDQDRYFDAAKAEEKEERE
jgi:MazG family protein